MPYSDKVREDVLAAPKSLGNQLGRWAIHLDFPVLQISQFTGATRQTVYNWFTGTEVTPSYRDKVTSLLNVLASSKTSEEAWRKLWKRQ
jgi:hypothetical protein